MDLNNRVFERIYFTDNIFINISETFVGTWVVGIILIGLAIITRIKLRNFKDVPETRFQKVIEALVEFFERFSTGLLTKKYNYFGPFFFGILLFIAFSNMLGLFAPLRPPTADLATNLAMSISTFGLMIFAGIRHGKKEFFKDYLRPIPVLLPLNIIGDVSIIASLSIRLFGNILSGLIIGGLLYMLLPVWMTIGIPAALSLFFDVFIALLQAYVFVVLSLNFIYGKVPQEA